MQVDYFYVENIASFLVITLCYANSSFNPPVEQKALSKTGFGHIYFTLMTSVRELNRI